MRADGLPNTFVPGRNLVFLTFAAALAYRRGLRHIVAGMCETDYSGYPDCRDDTIKAMQVALNLGMQQRFVAPHAADVARQGGDLARSRRSSAAAPLVQAIVEETHSCYLGDRAAAPRMGLRLRRLPRLRPAAARLGSLQRGAGARRRMRPAAPSRAEGFLFLLGFGLCIPAANWLIGNVGTVCVPGGGPCLIPVAPGLMAPSGVLMVGLALVLRDMVQRRLGLGWASAAVLAGAVLSALLAPPALVVASAAAFLLSEAVDLAVYTPLQRRGLVLAVALSSVAGLVLDSVVFLLLAFGSLDFLAGQVVGKLWMVLASLPLVAWLRRRDARLGLRAA